jgi:peroxiredoxin
MLQKGDFVPDIPLLDIHGAETTLDTILSDGKVLLAFFKISCPTCQLTLPFLERLYKSTNLIQVYGVSQDDPQSTKAFCERFGLTFPMLVDRPGADFPVSNTFAITEVPSLFLVEKDSEIEWAVAGFSRQALEDLGHDLHVAILRADDQVPEVKPG